MKKKILLIVRRHSGEIDYILPLLHRLYVSYEIITIFSDYQSYDSLLNSKELYSLWKKICSKYFIINNRKNLVYKIIYKFLIFIEKKISLPNYTKIFILKKIFDFEFFLKKFKLETNDINFIFTPVNNLSKLPYLFKYLSKNSRLVKFSESTFIFPSKDQNKILYKNNRNYNDIHTDIFLLTNNNYNYLLGFKINKNLQKKILYCGFFRYEKFWIRKINKFKKNLKTKKKIIVIATRAPDDLTLKKSSYIYIIESIVKFVKKIENIKIIFKTHSSKDKSNEETNIIKKILKINNFKSYIFSNNHPINLAINAHACITIATSVCLDFIYAKKSVIEFYNAKTENKNSAGVVFNLKNNKWMSIFENYKLVNNVKNDKEFRNQLKRHLKNKSKLNKINYKILKKINSNSFDSLKLSNYLKNM